MADASAQRLAARRRVGAAQGLAARLPALVLAAQRLAANAAQGRHGRRRAGSGEQFWQYRDVRDGESPRNIDWRRSARGERLYVREREWESVETLVLDVQDHVGMGFASQAGGETKLDRALLLALATAVLALDGGERVALYGRTPPFAGPGALDRLAAGFLLPPSAPPVAGRLALIGDFLDPVETVTADLACRAATVRGGVLVQVLDAAECDFPYRGRVLFERDDEPAEDIARAEDVAAAYRARLAAQRAAVVSVAEAARLVPLFHRTEAPASPVLAAIRAALEPSA